MTAEGAAPSPLTIGKHFVKQYYQVLQSNADQIFRFYQPSSFLSHAEGSNPTDPSGLENYDIAARWGIVGTESKGFAMEIGAIDAQTSIDNSILLVVTGSVGGGSAKDARKTFIHTFFLTYIPNTKRYYVANDVLRFLEEAKSKEPVPTEESATETIIEDFKEVTVVDISPTPLEVIEQAAVVPSPEDLSPGGGVEETKEEEVEEEVPVVQEPVVEPVVVAVEPPVVVKSKEESPKTAAGNRGKRGKAKAPQQQPKQQPAPKPTPGSWASLVASSPAATAPSLAASPAKPTPVEKTEVVEKTATPAPVPTPAPKPKDTISKDTGKGGQRGGGGGGGDRHKRDPDCTLVVKNLPDAAKDADLMILFEGFATSTGGKILGTTVSVHRGLGFVDYDSVPPVLAAVAKHQEQPIELLGRVLEVEQKTAEQRTRRNTRGGYQSGSTANGAANRGGGSGGPGRHNQYRRGNNERGDRGGGGGGVRGGK